jgi:hypothetical protein
MEITRTQYEQIAHCLPTQWGNVSLTNLSVLNTILYVAEQGCKWRGLPKRFGNWHTIYTRMLEQERCARPGVRATAASPDRAHQDRGGVAGQHPGEGSSRSDRGAKTNGPQAIGKSRGGWTTKIHLVAANARTAITFALSPGQAHDASEGRALLKRLGKPNWPIHMLMDRAYEGQETRQLALIGLLNLAVGFLFLL